MGRGAAQVRQMGGSAFKTFSGGYDAAGEQRNELRGSLLPRLETQATADVLPEEQKQQTRTLEAIDAAGDAGTQQIQNRVARTRNSAGAFGALAAAAGERARTKAGAIRDMATQRLQRKQGALSQLGQVYGIDTNLLGNMGNLQLGAINAYQGGTHGSVSLGPLGTWG